MIILDNAINPTIGVRREDGFDRIVNSDPGHSVTCLVGKKESVTSSLARVSLTYSSAMQSRYH